MSGYQAALVLHVIGAVLGVGAVAAVAIVARAARAGAPGAGGALPGLLRWTGASLGWMLLTGVALDFSVGGAYHATGWFRGSVVLMLATGALGGLARRALRAGDGPRAVVRVERLAYGMCALVAAIVALMEAKP